MLKFSVGSPSAYRSPSSLGSLALPKKLQEIEDRCDIWPGEDGGEDGGNAGADGSSTTAYDAGQAFIDFMHKTIAGHDKIGHSDVREPSDEEDDDQLEIAALEEDVSKLSKQSKSAQLKRKMQFMGKCLKLASSKHKEMVALKKKKVVEKVDAGSTAKIEAPGGGSSSSGGGSAVEPPHAVAPPAALPPPAVVPPAVVVPEPLFEKGGYTYIAFELFGHFVIKAGHVNGHCSCPVHLGVSPFKCHIDRTIPVLPTKPGQGRVLCLIGLWLVMGRTAGFDRPPTLM